MASTVDMDTQRAKQWQTEINELNKRLAQLLNGVNESVQTIQKGAEGSILSQLVQNVTEMFNAATELVKAFDNLVQSVGNLIESATKLAGKIVEGISTVGKFVGMLGI